MARPRGYHLDVAALDAALGDRNMSRAGLAVAAGVSGSTLSALCKPTRPAGATAMTALKLAAALDLEAADLFPRLHSATLVQDTTIGPGTCVSVDDVAATLGVSRSTVYGLIRSKELAAISVGARKVVPREALEGFMAAGGSRL